MFFCSAEYIFRLVVKQTIITIFGGNMQKIVFLILVIISVLNAAPVDRTKAGKVAANWFEHYAPQQLKNSKIANTVSTERNGVTVYYTVSFQNGGFVIVSADDAAKPLIGYSYTGYADPQKMHPALQNMLNDYAKEIVELAADTKAAPAEQWSKIMSADFSDKDTREDIAPLIDSRWDQGSPYNKYVPNGWPVGCVATAMAMVMDYYQQPKQGTGSHTYTDNNSGQTLTADFGSTVYEWKKMVPIYGGAVSQQSKDWVAKLSSHCGISVDMMYGQGGSGAYSTDCIQSLKDYFGFKQQANIKYRDDYSATDWRDVVKAELVLKRPLLYYGFGSGGHAFICDGYQSADNKLHFNWGWSGSYDGFFAIDGLNPTGSGTGGSSGGYNNGQHAIFNLFDYKEVPQKIASVKAVDLGNGTQFRLTWKKQQNANFKNYKVYLGKKSFDYYTSQITTDTALVLSGLQNDSLYFAGVTIEGINGQESRLAEAKCRVLLAPAAPLQAKATPQLLKIKLSWHPNQEVDLAGYELFRSSDNITFNKLNTQLITDTIMIDNSVSLSTYHYYKIRGVDTDGNPGAFSEVVKARAASLQNGILIVDETADGAGTAFSPNDLMVDSYFATLTAGATTTAIDLAANENKISLSDLGPYSTVIWHSQSTELGSVFSTYQAEIAAYLDLGGKMLITADKPTKLCAGNNSYPTGFSSGSFPAKYLGVDSTFYIAAARFKQAMPANSSYQVLNVDTAKAQDIYNNHLKKMEAFKTAAGAQTIYTYGSEYLPGTSMGSLVGKAVGILKTSGSSKVITLSVPLYYIRQNDARELMVKILRDEFGETVGIDTQENLANSSKLRLNCYPNPFNPVTKINFELKTADYAKLSVYNAAGQLVKTLFEGVQQPGKHSVNFNAAELNSGVYFYKLETPAGSAINKALLIK